MCIYELFPLMIKKKMTNQVTTCRWLEKEHFLSFLCRQKAISQITSTLPHHWILFSLIVEWVNNNPPVQRRRQRCLVSVRQLVLKTGTRSIFLPVLLLCRIRVNPRCHHHHQHWRPLQHHHRRHPRRQVLVILHPPRLPVNPRHWRCLLTARFVVASCLVLVIWKLIYGLTLEKNLLNVMFVVNVLLIPEPGRLMPKLTREKNHLNVTHVVASLLILELRRHILARIQVKNRTHVKSVTSVLLTLVPGKRT